jgi:hypothetical protein
VTYRLRLETLEEKPRRLAFEVRALDGATLPPYALRRRHTEIVLMPSARVEVLLQRCTGEDAPADCVEPGQEVRARLRTAGISTGVDADSGDVWPAVDLASVVFEAAPGRSRPVMRSVQPAGPAPASSELPAPAPRASGSAPLAPARPAACDYRRYQAGPADFRLDSNLVRLVRFNNRDFGDHGGELFGIHVENFRMVDDAGKPVPVTDLVAEGRLE